MREGRIERDGASIAYEVWDGGRHAVATPLVLLPGWACSRSVWRETARRMCGHRTCILIDLAGAGDSPIHDRASQTLQTLAQDVIAVMAEEGLRQAVLVAHSMGGAVALEAAAIAPDVVSAVVGVETLIHPEVYDAAGDDAVQGAMAALRRDFAGSVRASLEPYIHPGPNEARARAQVAAMAAANADQLLPVLEDLMRWDVASALARTDVPVAVIAASSLQREGRSPPWAPRVQLFWVDEVGHFVMAEDPDAFQAALEQALAWLRS